jgi:anti-sigma factor RsiW
MGCESWQVKLDAYLDGELPSEQMRAYDAHVRNCLSCSSAALALVQRKRSVQDAGKRYTASPEFRKRIQASISARPQRNFSFAWRTAAAAFALLLVVGTTYWGTMRNGTGQAFAEVADLHVATLASSSPVDVVSTDKHTVKPWFQGKIPFSFELPELQNSEFTLLGGRMAYLEQAPGAHLIYQVRKHQVSVFIFQEASLRSKLQEDATATKRLSFHVESWSRDGLRYFVIGDAGASDIDGLARLFKATGA